MAAADADAESRTFAEQAWQAREALGVEDVALRLVGGGVVADRDDGTATARLRASWETGDDSVLAGTDVQEATLLLRVAATADAGVSLRSVEPDADPVPLWLAGDVTVEQADDARVVRIDGGDPEVAVTELAETAARTVRASVPTGDDVLTVVSPATPQLAAAVLGRTTEDLQRVAAVTTTVDGTRETARLVVLNPALFDTMDERAAQVVVSHEAVHQLTGIIGTDVETWVGEGFADWVALRDDDAPLSLSAGQALRLVLAEGPPDRLPTQEDFASAEHGIGAVYELAWLAFRMLDEQGVADAAIVAFYQQVLDGRDTDAAARDTLGFGVDELTARWQDYLTKSASTLS